MWELDCEESWAPKNWCFWTVVLEKTLKSPLDCKEIQPVHPEGDQSWVLIGRTDAEAKTPILWPPHAKSWPWCWEGLGAGGEEEDRGWDGWMASLTRWTRVWVNSGSWWWTGRPGVLRFMGSQRVGHDWVTELNQTDKWPRCIFRNSVWQALYYELKKHEGGRMSCFSISVLVVAKYLFFLTHLHQTHMPDSLFIVTWRSNSPNPTQHFLKLIPLL